MTARPKLSLNHNLKSGTEVLTGNNEHLLADIAYAAKGPLPQSMLDEAKRRLLAAGCGPGLGKYKGGGPSAVL